MANNIDVSHNTFTAVWKIAFWVFLAGWIIGATMTMWNVRAGFVSSYLSDLVFPPWFYILIRGLTTRRVKGPHVLKWFSRSPERAALSIFLVGLGSELCQLFWPQKIIKGQYDPWDIVAYFFGLILCYGLEKWQLSQIDC